MDTDTHGSESELTEAVIGAAFEVANVLGAGFLEKVYERALIRELALRGVNAKAQVPFRVCYKGRYVGEYLADLVVEGEAHRGTKVCGAFCQRASGAMHQLPEGFRPASGATHQFPKAQGGLETRPPGPPALARTGPRRVTSD